MLTQDVRRQFLKYFKDRQHTVLPSSPVVPHDDPSLLFINAGMNQFKDIFLGKSKRDYVRAATSQKCIRVGGKHNDLENVGHTKRHLTFFEMLGNFSFGDYFKKEAIQFAWDVSTQVFAFDGERIWPSIFRDDEEAFEIWKQYVPEKRIIRFGEQENFWAMGETGPCGPCSELLYDRGPNYGEGTNPLEDPSGERFPEFWNLVFMQNNRQPDGVMLPLPKPSIDTGAGLERIMSFKMEVDSVFDTDVLRGIIAKIEHFSGLSYSPKDPVKGAAFRVIADHLRCLAFAIADGVQPSNVDRGYVLRKVLRRAVRYGRSLGLNDPFLSDILPSLVESMGGDYPELQKGHCRIAEILTTEEEAFIRTLRRGGNMLGVVIEQAQAHKKTITGDDAFKLKDTYGFPIEEILLLAKDAGLEVDAQRYHTLEEEAKERSRKVQKSTQQIASENLFSSHVETAGSSEFLGYMHSSAEGKVTALVVDGQFVEALQTGEEGLVVLDKTPFYAEMGGQAADTGKLESSDALFVVTDCRSPYKGVIAHWGKLEKGILKVGMPLLASIDTQRRQKIANNHTATHLLHWALHHVLGEHVKQAGSVVEPSRLRFDFSHHKALTDGEIHRIEDLVNGKIRENLPVQSYEISYEEAQKRHDIKQFFGEKYGAQVRVVDIDYSKELCGGTHTSALGNIGFFRIAKESSIASGMRRIEAVTGIEADLLARECESQFGVIAAMLKTQPLKLKERVEKLIEESKQLTAQLKAAKKDQVANLVDSLLSQIQMIGHIPLLTAEVSLTPEELRSCADEIMNKARSAIAILAVKGDGRCQLLVRVSSDLTAKGIQAIEIVKALAPTIEGSGGGKADSAQAGGKAPHRLDEAFALAREIVKKIDMV